MDSSNHSLTTDDLKREIALRMAVQDSKRQPNESPEAVTARAQEFYGFLMGECATALTSDG